MLPDRVIHRNQPLTGTGWLHQAAGSKLQALGAHAIRYGLAMVILWIGLMKFTAYEAAGIQPLVASSPLMGWMYSFLSVREFSAGLGIVESAVAVLIALRPWFPRASAAGSAAAVFMFLTTLSFLFSAPGWETTLGGFPALSSSVGQFLIKDVVLLGAAIWTCGEAYSAKENHASKTSWSLLRERAQLKWHSYRQTQRAT
jgi:reactive chlorine resistance protein C